MQLLFGSWEVTEAFICVIRQCRINFLQYSRAVVLMFVRTFK